MLKIGVQSAGWYRHEDPVGSLSYIKEHGFDAIDFNIDHYLPVGTMAKEEAPYTSFFDQSIEEILAYFAPLRDASLQTGVAICQAHAPFPTGIKDKDALNEHILMALEKCLAVCAYIGCPAIVVHPMKGETKEEEWAQNLHIYRRLMPVAKRTGVKICLENLFTHRPGRIIATHLANVTTACSMIDLLNAEAGEDIFGFCFDVGHANLAHVELRAYIKELGDRLTILHIHDNDGLDDLHMIPYSYLATGSSPSCDWEAFIKGLGEIGYKGVLCFETFRIFSAYPQAAHSEALRLISAIGHDWAARLEKN